MKCYLYEVLLTQSVTYTKCYLYNKLLTYTKCYTNCYHMNHYYMKRCWRHKMTSSEGKVFKEKLAKVHKKVNQIPYTGWSCLTVWYYGPCRCCQFAVQSTGFCYGWKVLSIKNTVLNKGHGEYVFKNMLAIFHCTSFKYLTQKHWMFFLALLIIKR